MDAREHEGKISAEKDRARGGCSEPAVESGACGGCSEPAAESGAHGGCSEPAAESGAHGGCSEPAAESGACGGCSEPAEESRACGPQERSRRAMEAAVRAGHILLENGAEISRVEETIDRICRFFGIESGNAFVLSNGIFATMGSVREQYFAKVQHIPVSGARLNRVAAVNQLSREIAEGRYTIGEVETCLDTIEKMPGKTNFMQYLASAVGSASFCYLFGGDLADSAAAFVSGFLLYIYVIHISAPKLSKLVGNIGGGALVTLLCMVMYHLGFGHHISQVIIGSVIPLIPGVAFTNAIRDIADGDYISGSVRMLDAMLVFIGIALGVGLMFTVYHRVTGGILL